MIDEIHVWDGEWAREVFERFFSEDTPSLVYICLPRTPGKTAKLAELATLAALEGKEIHTL